MTTLFKTTFDTKNFTNNKEVDQPVIKQGI